jgi:hypothetical protein
MHRFCRLASVAGLLTIVCQAVRAQQPDTLSAPQRIGLALARLSTGQTVRVHDRPFGLVVGRVVANSANLLTLDTGGSQTAVLTSNVDSLWLPSGGHAGKGALIGVLGAGS